MNRMYCFLIAMILFAAFDANAQDSEREESRKSKEAMREAEFKYHFKDDGKKYSVRFFGGPALYRDATAFTGGEHSTSVTGETSGTPVKDIYGDYLGPVSASGGYGFEFCYAFGPRFQISGALGSSFYWADSYDAVTNVRKGSRCGAVITLVPRAKLMYHNRPNFKVYGYLGVGVAYHAGFANMNRIKADGKSATDNRFSVCGDLCPVGLEFGKALFGFGEICFSHTTSFVRAGIGYRF